VTYPGSIWYTPTTGIWQTVWLEPVPDTAIRQLRLTPDIDAGTLQIDTLLDGSTDGIRVRATALEQGRVVAIGEAAPDESLTLNIDHPRLWSPDSPYLYDLTVTLVRDGAAVDEVGSYFGMRKISAGPDETGVLRLLLNNQPQFQFGLLDQGFWPDGIYTAPTDEALRYDIEITRQLGFNLIRKHVKIEPARWYYWADKLGVLVWQDMPSSGPLLDLGAAEETRSPDSAIQFETELLRMVNAHYNSPAIVVWVLFNEGWGQYDTVRLTQLLESLDSTRLIDSASGWNDRETGDLRDTHRYPGPAAPMKDPNRISVLGEFGGLGLPVAGHTWQDENSWGYQEFTDAESLRAAYARLVGRLPQLITKNGLAAAIYTQTTDVEVEVNGMMTYDRAVIKMGADEVRAINEPVYQAMPGAGTP
jgi:hypothetical protein